MGHRTEAERHRERGRPARTLLEQLIREERGQTYEEFVTYAEEFARRNRLRGTVSLRHLLRLATGKKQDGSPIGRPRPATAELLERIFGLPIGELLTSPGDRKLDHATLELRQRLNASCHVDSALIDLLHAQLDNLRRLDRQMGAIVTYGEVREKVRQVSQLHTFSLTPNVRTALSAVLSELGALAGWEALDQYDISQSWDHHELAKLAAREAESPGLLAHAVAQQAFILSEIGEVHLAIAQLAKARNLVKRSAPRLLRAWLAAAHGEGLAAAGRRDEALKAFDAAGTLLPAEPIDPTLPFLFLGSVHLDRWRGHALARLGEVEAVGVLIGALERLDPTFTRAEVSLRVDLAAALVAIGENEVARAHVEQAERLATEIGSVRQRRRLHALIGKISSKAL